MKTGIINGCSRSIGLATAPLLCKKNDTIAIGTSTSSQHNIDYPNFIGLQLNLADSASIQNFVQEINNRKIDFLINNAAILLEKWDASEINLEQLRTTFDVNVFGTIELTEKLVPYVSKPNLMKTYIFIIPLYLYLLFF